MNTVSKSFTYGLFAMPRFLLGAARALDLGATLDVYNTSTNENDADAIAIMSDWCAVGSDLSFAMEQYADGK